MRLVAFYVDDRPWRGIVEDETVVAVDAGPAWFAERMPLELAAIREAANASTRRFPLDAVELLAPVRPGKLLGIGLNYAAHVLETGRPLPEHPVVFNKQTTCVNGPRASVSMPVGSSMLDFEGELGVVIGASCRRVSVEQALDYVAGYVVCNDLSIRDWQARTPTMTLGKSYDTHGPMGPWLVTADEIPDPQSLTARTWVNGNLRQDFSTRDMIFSCAQLIAYLSAACTLEPGDTIATGTGSGVARWTEGVDYLAAGDSVRVEIESIGAIENAVVAPS